MQTKAMLQTLDFPITSKTEQECGPHGECNQSASMLKKKNCKKCEVSLTLSELDRS